MKKSKKSKLLKKLTSTFQKHRFARIKRYVAKDDYYIDRGYIVALSDKLLILQETQDFQLLGYTAIQVDHITSIRYNKHDRYYDHIMEHEGQLKEFSPQQDYQAAGWQELFTKLQAEDRYVIVECERKSSNNWIIGPITTVKGKSVRVHYFDAAGVWDAEATKIRYRDVTKVGFRDRYLEVFRGYV